MFLHSQLEIAIKSHLYFLRIVFSLGIHYGPWQGSKEQTFVSLLEVIYVMVLCAECNSVRNIMEGSAVLVICGGLF